MKKTVLISVAVMLLLSAFLGCSTARENGGNFDFSLAARPTSYGLGETVRITATVTNVSGKAYRYVGSSGNDFVPAIELYCDGEGDGQRYYIAPEPIVFPTDVVNKRIKNGKSGSCDYTFLIPEDARLGSYNVTLSFGGEQKEFSDVLRVAETADPRESYQYSSTVVNSGAEGIRPIRTLSWKTQYAANGNELLTGDGEGSYGLFRDPGTDPNTFPTLTVSGEITVNVSEHTKIGTPTVYDLDYEPIESSPGWKELHMLPVGEYIVVFSETEDERNTRWGLGKYWVTGYENVFRIIILPSGKMNEFYEHAT